MKAWLYILCTGMIFGVGGLVTKYLIDRGLDPVFGTAVMMAGTALGSIPLYLRSGGLESRGWRIGILAGALNAGGPAMLFNLGFENLPASVTTILISLGPVFTAVTAHFVSHHDRFTTAKVIGLASAVSGVGFLVGGLTASTLIGVVYASSGAALQGASLVLVKRLSSLYRPVTTLTPLMAGATVACLIVTAVGDRWQSPTQSEWMLMAALGISGVAAFGAILAAAEIAPASQTALSGYLIPLIGVIGGVVFFGEPFGWRTALGGSLVLTGVVLVGRDWKGVRSDEVAGRIREVQP